MSFKGPLSGNLHQHPEIRQYISEHGNEATPREISLYALAVSYLGSMSCMLVILLFMFFKFVPMQDLNDIYIDNFGFSKTEKTTGIVVKTGKAKDGMNLVDYKYTIEGVRLTGFSFYKGTIPMINSSIIIEYVPNDPALSRIEGGNYSMGILSKKIFFGVLFVLGGLFFYFTFRFIKRLLLLRNGHFTMAKLISMKKTGASVNYQTVMKLTYSFKANGQSRDYTIKTHEVSNLTDEAEEIMLYQPNSYSHFDMLLIDELPANLSIKNVNNGVWIIGDLNFLSLLGKPFWGLIIGWFASNFLGPLL